MTLEFVRGFLDADMLMENVRRITMCGDVGDPIYCREFIDICRYIKSVNPAIHIFIVTNGSNRSSEWWQSLAQVLDSRDTINFSIDGYDDTSNNLYRVNSDFGSIITGIKTVRQHNSGVFLNWAMIVFRFNQDRINDIVHQAKDLGMDGLQITKSTKFGSKYGGYGGDADGLEPRSEFVSASHRYERQTINLSGRQIDNRAYLDHNQHKYIEIQQQYREAPVVPMCEIGNRGIYVNAEGVVFPCSWVSFPYDSLSHGDKTIHWQHSFFAHYRDRMNLNNRAFDDIVNDPLWHKCSQGWRDPGKTWVECSQKCSADLVDANYAVGWETN